MTAALSFKDLQHVYNGATVLAPPDWCAEKGEQWLFLGPSGCGKTTLLHILAGLLTPSAGVVSALGKEVSSLSPAAQDLFRGRQIGIVFQQLHLIDALTVMSNVILAQSLARCRPDPERVRELLVQLDIADKAHAFPRQLSFGQAQRVALARALINQPQIILADEPTSSLDDANAHRVTELLLEQASLTESVLVVASHDTRISNQIPHRLDLLASPGKP